MKKAIFFQTTLLLTSLAAALPLSASAKMKSNEATLRQHDAEFQRCYEAELLRSKKRTSGRVNIRITLDKSGKVVETGPTKNTTKSRFLADCLVRAIERIPFGKQKKSRTVFVHPFKFSLPKQ